MSDLTFQIASSYVTKFSADFETEDPVMALHAEAMRCRDCEDHIERGVKALEWIEKSESLLIEAESIPDQIQLEPDLRNSVVRLYAMWMRTAEKAESEIASLENLGHFPDNLDKFRAAIEKADEAVQRHNLQSLANSALAQMFDQDPW